MRFKYTAILALVLAAFFSLQAHADVQDSLQRIERLWDRYRDTQENPANRAQSLEDIITTYQRMLDQDAPASATVGQILDGEIKWRLALANALVIERTIQSRLAVEELGLTGPWATDLSGTISRADKVLNQTSARLEQIIRHIKADPQFERNYVVTGLHLRVAQARIAVGYYRGWTLFYRSLLTTDQLKRDQLLQSAIECLRVCCSEKPDELPAVQSNFRPEFRNRSVLLMVKALRYSARLSEADKLLSWLERKSLDQQMAYEAALQRCRLLRDQQHCDTALAGVAQLRSWCDLKQTTRDISVQLTLAYLECTVRSAQAREAVDGADLALAAELNRKRLQPLAKIFHAQNSDQVRSIIYEQIYQTRLTDSYAQSWDELGSLEVLAMGVASAQQDNITVAMKHFDALLARADPNSRKLWPETLFQAGKAASDSNHILACEYLDRLARDFPDSPQARSAVLLAVQVAARYRAAEPDNESAEKACLTALQRLMESYPDSNAAKSWRFYWADLLFSRSDVATAAKQFALIEKNDPQYVPARYYQLQCRKHLLANSEESASPDADRPLLELAGLARGFIDLDRYVLAPATPAGHRDKNSRRYGAMARLAAAGMFCADLDQIETGLMLLGTLSSDYTDQDDVISQALRYRIVALAKLGRLNDAVNLTLLLLRDGPADSAKIADALLLRLSERFTDADPDSLSPDDKSLAGSWVRLAKARIEIIQKPDSPSAQTDQELLASQEMLASALFIDGKFDDALAILNQLQQTYPSSAEYIRASGKVLLAQKDFDAASGQWRRLVLGLKADSPEWFEAWYYALLTNYRAGSDPQQIVLRIKQLQSLNPEMGSEKTCNRFGNLLEELASNVPVSAND